MGIIDDEQRRAHARRLEGIPNAIDVFKADIPDLVEKLVRQARFIYDSSRDAKPRVTAACIDVGHNYGSLVYNDEAGNLLLRAMQEQEPKAAKVNIGYAPDGGYEIAVIFEPPLT